MTDNIAHTSDQLRKAVETVRRLRPAYATLLDFYVPIFLAQEDSMTRIDIAPIKISEDNLSIKRKEGFPLINLPEFVIDREESNKLFRKMCGIAEETNEEMKLSARGIIRSIDAGELDLNTLSTGLLGEDDLLFEKIADDLKVDAKVFAFITYNSIKPSLSVCASQLSIYLDEDKPWERGYCPVCGKPPVLSMFEGEGKRFLFCSFCWHKWPARRIYCPFCDNRDSKTLRYLKSEEEPEYRLDVCDKCKRYVKTVDTREIARIVYPPLEDVSTVHLDIKAKETGFESGI